MRKLNMGKFARNHDILAEIIWYVGDHLSRIILNIWNAKSVPKNWECAIMILLDMYGNYLDIPLF